MKEKTLNEKTFTEDGLRVIDWENVKQAIKELKEEIFTPNNKSKTFIELNDLKLRIEKHFGKELSK